MIIVCAMLYALSVSLSVKSYALIIASMLPLTLVIKRPEIIKSLVKINAFNLIMIITLALTWPDIREGFITGIIIALRVNMIYIIFAELIFTQSESKLYDSLVFLRVPEKLCILLLLTFRGINIMRERLDSALISLRLRAPDLGVMMRLKTFAYITASVLLQSASHSERMTRAIICRGGFDGFRQTDSMRLTLHDVINLSLFASYSLVIIIMNHV
ncbi:MAG: hypothetical protein IJP48_06540 [Synergistaceae bacterium]|nr:hypothetical protein [Synergistaceae bacterium]